METSIKIEIIRYTDTLHYGAIIKVNDNPAFFGEVAEEWGSPTPAETLGHAMFWLSRRYPLEKGVKLDIELIV